MNRLLRVILRLLPGEFQDAYRRDLEATVRAQRRDAGGPAARTAVTVSALTDIVRVAPALHWDILRRDLRFAWRAMAARPLQTLAAIGTLALGLGAAVGIFAVLDAVWLQPLPYRDADRLVTVGETSNGSLPGPMGYLTFLDVRAQTRALEGVSAASLSIATVTSGDADAERINIMRASGNYLQMIGAAPAIGRWFTAQEDKPGAARRVTILSDRLWRRRYHGDPAVVGRFVQYNAIPYQVIGVMPAGFDDLVATRLYKGAEAWTPLGYDPTAAFACRTCRHLRVFGLLAPGRTPDEATRELNGVIGAVAAANPKEYDRPDIAVTPLSETFFGPVRQTLVILAVAVGLLLLVACGNVSNLLLLRASERTHEVAVRTALGVTTSRLARQLLTESILLALAGGVAGVPIAWAIARFFVRLAPPALPRLAATTLDARALAVGLLLGLVSAAIFGLAPMIQVLRRPVAGALHGAGRRTAGQSTWRLRAALVAGNVAMAAMLLVSSGLLIRSLMGLLSVDLGFVPERALTLQINVGGARFVTPDNATNIRATSTFYDEVLSRVRALPGVSAAAGVTTLPMGGDIDGYGLHVAGRPLANPESAPSADRFLVTPDYFKAAGMTLKRGRLLDASDGQRAPPVVVVNETMAREVFPGEDAIGHRVALGGPDGAPRTIVGIVNNVRHRSLDGPIGYQVYAPQDQWAWAETDLTLIVRSTQDPSTLAAPIRAIVREVDAAQAISRVQPYVAVVADATSTRRVAAQIIGLFALAAVALAIVGLSGALGVVAAQRRHEMGVRMVLGASAALVARLIVRQGLRPALAGLAAGLLAAAVLAGALQSLLYGVSRLDPATFGVVGAGLLAAAAIACAIPAWRASRANPAAALRLE